MLNIADLSEDQAKAREEILRLLKEREPLVTLGGYAGTGKTTLLSVLSDDLRAEFGSLSFACYTGKAKGVLESKLKESGALTEEDSVGTLHQLLYKTTTERVYNEKKDRYELHPIHTQKMDKKRGLIVVDEASMVDEEIFGHIQDLELPILAVGDHGQLPPIRGRFNLMQNPMVRLEKIHRQAEGNPIIQCSIMARQHGAIPFGKHGETVLKSPDMAYLRKLKNPHTFTILCGTNRVRCQVNAWMRSQLGYSGLPQPGERIICLKNNWTKQIYNGMNATVKQVEAAEDDVPFKSDHLMTLTAETEDNREYRGEVLKNQFGSPKLINYSPDPGNLSLQRVSRLDAWDFGYALTVHKSQGSEFPSVFLVEEPAMRYVMSQSGDWNRWLYTGVTRAKANLLITPGVSL